MKQKKQVVALGVLMAIAAIVWYFERVQPAIPESNIALADANPPLLPVENLQIKIWELEEARKTEYKSSGRNIFSPIAPPPPQAVPASKPRDFHEPYGPQKPPPPPPEPPLTLPAKFFGYATVPNTKSRRAFFTNGDDVYIIAEGEVLLNRFRILRIGNASLEFEEISTGRRGTAPLEDQSTGGPAA